MQPIAVPGGSRQQQQTQPEAQSAPSSADNFRTSTPQNVSRSLSSRESYIYIIFLASSCCKQMFHFFFFVVIFLIAKMDFTHNRAININMSFYYQEDNNYRDISREIISLLHAEVSICFCFLFLILWLFITILLSEKKRFFFLLDFKRLIIINQKMNHDGIWWEKLFGVCRVSWRVFFFFLLILFKLQSQNLKQTFRGNNICISKAMNLY